MSGGWVFFSFLHFQVVPYRNDPCLNNKLYVFMPHLFPLTHNISHIEGEKMALAVSFVVVTLTLITLTDMADTNLWEH